MIINVDEILQIDSSGRYSAIKAVQGNCVAKCWWPRFGIVFNQDIDSWTQGWVSVKQAKKHVTNVKIKCTLYPAVNRHRHNAWKVKGATWNYCVVTCTNLTSVTWKPSRRSVTSKFCKPRWKWNQSEPRCPLQTSNGHWEILASRFRLKKIQVKRQRSLFGNYFATCPNCE